MPDQEKQPGINRAAEMEHRQELHSLYVRMIIGWAGAFWALLDRPDVVEIWTTLSAYSLMATLLPVFFRKKFSLFEKFRIVVLAVDVLLISILSYFFGSQSTKIPFLYLLLVAGAQIQDDKRSGTLVLLMCLAGYGAVLALEKTGVIPRAPWAIIGPVVHELPDRAYKSFFITGGCMVVMYMVVSFAMARVRAHLENAASHMLAEREAHRRYQMLRGEVEARSRLEGLGRLAGGVAHDFNNLLTIIAGYTEAMYEEADDDDPVRHELSEVIKATSSATQLTEQLLAFSSRQKVERVVIDLGETILGLETMLGRLLGERTVLRVGVQGGLGPVLCDQGQIEQVIVNLVVNARDAMPGGGTVEVLVSEADLPAGLTTEFSNVDRGEYVKITVSDQGSGIDDDDRKRIFEPFFSKKKSAGGTGLGLATVYGIVRQNDGAIEVKSRIDRGTVFEIYLPSAKSMPLTKNKNAVSELPGLLCGKLSGTVMLVEDDDSVRRTAVRMLSATDLDLIEASSGEEALELLREYGRSVRLVISDVIMTGMTGIQMLEMAAEMMPEIKAVFISGYSLEELEKHGFDRLVHRCLRKPFSKRELIETIGSALSPASEIEGSDR